MDQGLVSVIMPAYNAAPHICAAIKSVQAQTHTNWELIIVDDGSTDDTAEIIKSFTKADPRIIYLFQNRGRQGKARNLAIKHSKGAYIAFLDADDLWIDNKLQKQLDVLENLPDVDLVFSQGYFLMPDGRPVDIDVKIKEWTWAHDRDVFINGNQIAILSVMVKRDAVLKVGCFVEDLEIQNLEDYHLWIKLLKEHRFLSIPDRLFYYRIHSNQATQNHNEEDKLTNCFFDLVETGFIDQTNKALQKRFKWFIFHASDLDTYLKQAKAVFPGRRGVISIVQRANHLFPNNNLLKRLFFKII